MRHLKSIFISMILCIMSLISYTTTSFAKTNSWPKGPSVISESAIVMEANTGVILYEKDINKKLYPASITKIMTALVALENNSLDEVITFSSSAVNGIERNSSNVGVYIGEQLTLEQSLYAMMLESANEVSTGIAEHVAGSVEAFTKLMNKKAKELGCKNTHFANANGLHDDNHYTCAYDMALISQAAYKLSTFRTIISTKQFVVSSTNMRDEPLYFNNHHEMLNPRKYLKYRYDSCTGGKTGYTDMAKNTLVSFANKDGVELICVVMKSQNGTQPENIYTDTIALFNYVYDNYTQHNITDNTDLITIDNSLLFSRFNPLFNSEQPLIKFSTTGNILLPNSVSINKVTQSIEYYDNISIQEGENIIGQIVYSYNKKIVGRTDIIYTKVANNQLTFGTEITEKNLSDHSIKQLFMKSNSDEISIVKVLSVVATTIILLAIIFFLIKYWYSKRDIY